MVRLIVAIALVSAPAFAQTIYRWTDATGTLHYTDDPAEAPKGAKVETTEGEELGDVTVTKPTRPANANVNVNLNGNNNSGSYAYNEPIPVPPPPASAGRRGRDDEEYWRDAFRKANDKAKSLETDVAIDQKKLGGDGSLLTGASEYGCAPNSYGNTTYPGYAGYDDTTQPGVVYGRGHGQLPQGPTVQYPPYISTRYGYLPYYCDFQRIRDRIESNKAALARAKEELTDLDRRAANAAVPLEWRR